MVVTNGDRTMSTPRKHHFVPQFYLAGFTPSGSKDDKLFVLDKTTGRQWRSCPGDAGCQKDFYLIEVDDEGGPVAIEKLLSLAEASGAEAIRFIIDNETVPEGDLSRKLAEFLAIMTIRVPGILDKINEFVGEVCRSLMYLETASQERWGSLVAELKQEGKLMDNSTWEEMRDFVRSNDYDISMSQNFKMTCLLNMLEPAVFLMTKRKWTLLRSPEAGPEFISSDRPLSVHWTDSTGKGPFPPGLGVPGTSVFFPLNKRLALWGRFEGAGPPRDLDGDEVGVFNGFTGLFAQRFLYSTKPDFAVTLGVGKLGGKKELMAASQSPQKEPNDSGL